MVGVVYACRRSRSAIGGLLLGLGRLRQYRRESEPLDPIPASFEWAQRTSRTAARIRVSPSLAGPVTFGFADPVVLVPPRFGNLSMESQRAIAIHELLHVRRGDWLWSLLEAAACSLLWFHPLIWWLEHRLRVCREEIVDAESVTLTGALETYVSALLSSTGAAVPDLAPAPTFFFRRGLARRVEALYQEVPVMSRLRFFFSASTAAAVLAAVMGSAIARFPLTAAPQLPDSGVQLDSASAGDVIYQHPVAYPMAARKARVEGTVVVEAVVNPDGTVADARVISGPDELRRAALESVLQWQYRNEARTRRIVQSSIQFKRQEVTDTGFHEINVIRVLPSAAKARQLLEARLAPYQGQKSAPQVISEIAAIVRPYGLDVAHDVRREGDVTLVTLTVGTQAELSAGAETPGVARLRIGGNVQAKKKNGGVPPKYPLEAKAARIQGTVRFNVLIGQNGHVKNLSLVAGHPILVTAAQEAVATWTWEPTHLNGNPVEVLTVVDVNFTLAP